MFYNLESVERTAPLFDALEKCKGVVQDPTHHPEGDVFIHSVQTLNIAMRESVDIDLIIAAMVHDIGKAIDRYGHETYSIKLLDGLLSDKTIWLVKNHMRFWYFVLGKMKKRKKCNDLINNAWFSDLALLCRWDKMGRNPNISTRYDRVAIINRLQNIASRNVTEAELR